MKKNRKIVSILLIFAMVLGSLPVSAFSSIANAQDGSGTPEITVDEKPFTLRPREIRDLDNWKAGENKDDELNRSSVKLQERFRGNIINPLSNNEAKIQVLALMNSKAETRSSVGAEGFKTYAFDNWQYTDSMIFWDGKVPTPDVIDAAHRNGVPIYGTLFFNWSESQEDVRILKEFLREDSDGSKTYPSARKYVEIAKYYGFDGYFINQETHVYTGNLGRKMREWMLYAKRYAKELNHPIRLSWYDAMTDDGPRVHYDSVNSHNDGFITPDSDGTIPGDEFFINFNWSFAKNNSTAAHMEKIGRSPYDAYAGFELQQNSINTRIRFDQLVDSNSKAFLSIGLFTPDSILGFSADGEDYHVQERNFWTGYEGDPSISGDRNGWRGMSRFVSDYSPIVSLPFKTNFNTGHGRNWFENGELSRNYDWNARGVSEVLPTWRWWIESESVNELQGNYDFDTAYYGGTSVKFEGELDSTNRINLFSTKFDATSTTKLSITHKGGAGSKISVGVSTDENYGKDSFEYFPLKESENAWVTDVVDLSQFSGQKVRAINLKVEGTATDYKLNLGQLAIYDDDSRVSQPQNVSIKEHLLFDAKNSEAIITFDKVEGADYYVVYAKVGEKYEFIQASSSNIMYLPNIKRTDANESRKQDMKIVAVGLNGTVSEDKVFPLDWKMEVNDTGVGLVKEPENVALNAKVTGRSSEVSGEKASNALNGTITGNSDKWTALAYEGWMSIELSSPKTVRRWRVEHAGHGGESVNDGKMNTKDFSLQYKDEHGEWRVAKAIVGNRAHVTDVNLDTPITAKEWKLDITAAHNGSPWGAIRIYNWKMYEEELDLTGTRIVPISQVTVEHVKDNKYNVVLRNVDANTKVELLKDRNGNEVITSKSTENSAAHVVFKEVVLNNAEELLYYRTTAEGRYPSEILAIPFKADEDTPSTPGENQPSSITYEIYPVPQNISYENTGRKLTQEVNVVLEDGLDKYTLDKVDEILSSNDLTKVVGTEIIADKTNILVGIKGSGKFVDKYFENKGLEDNFGKYDAYQIISKDNIIAVLGKDSDAAFYGLQTLVQVLEQSSENVVRHFTINDFANQKIRGVIEGYYGRPWGNENRKELLEFGAKYKNNAMIFAPKDDPYHREKWREQYPPEELEGFKMLGEAGLKNKNRFVWTISPFKKAKNSEQSQPITSSNVDDSIRDLLAKFDQLYSVGIRQFGVLADDVGNLPYTTVVKVMKAVSEWAKGKDDKVYDTVFVPQNYTLGNWGNRSLELGTYQREFPEDIHIMYTGTSVLAPVTQSSISMYKRSVYGVTMRDPLFWLNWPVNDIDRSDFRRVFMGKGSMLETGVKNLAGVVTNPLEEPHASLPAIFAVADYTWNTDAFNAQKSWEDSFKYIEPNAPEDLKEIATHMANADNNGIRGLEESAELKKLMDNFRTKLATNNKTEIIEAGNALKEGYQKIVSAVDSFKEKSTFTKLKNELDPYISGLHDKALAATKYIEIILEKYSVKSAKDKLTEVTKLEKEAKEAYEKSKTYKVTTVTSEFPNATFRAESGTKWINPNINSELIPTANAAIEAIKEEAADPGTPDQPIAEGSKPFELKVSNIIKNPSGYFIDYNSTRTREFYAIDKDENTFAWYGIAGDTYRPGYYFGLDLGETRKLGAFKFIMGGVKENPLTDGGKDDYFKQYKVRYSNDKINWNDFGDPITQNQPKKTVTIDFSKDGIEARYVIIEAMNQEKKWVRISEMSITVFEKSQEQEDTPISFIELPEGGLKYTLNSDEDLVFKVNEDEEFFSTLRINGDFVAQENYTTAQGSTIITLSKNYLNTLEAGSYNLEVVYKSKQAGPVRAATTTLQIVKPAIEPELPNPFEQGKIKVVSVDAGRKYFSVEKIKQIIDTLAKNDYTHLHLLLGNDGMRFILDDMTVVVGSKTYQSQDVKDGILAGNREYARLKAVTEDAEKALTEDEMDQIFEYADTKGIKIIPAINSPGHMDAILVAMQRLGIENPNFVYYGRKSLTTMDLEKEEVVGFTKELLQLYIDYFESKEVEIFNFGADEYANQVTNVKGWSYLINSGKYQKFVDYVNDIAKRSIEAGMLPMAFNDGFYYNNVNNYKFNKNIVIALWTAGWSGFNVANSQKLVEKGHKILNVNDSWYYVVGREDAETYNRQSALRNMKSGTKGFDVTVGSQVASVGSMIAVWNDFPSNEFEMDKFDEWVKTFAESNPKYFKIKEEPKVNKDDLKALVEETEAMMTEIERVNKPESVERLKTVLEKAKGVINDETADQPTVNSTLEELKEVLAKLEPKEKANKDVLKITIELVRSLDEKFMELLKEESKAKLIEKLKEAEELYNEEYASQERVNQVVEELINIYKNLELKEEEPKLVDKTKLKALIEKVEKKVQELEGKITQESKEVLTKALEDGKKVLEKDPVTEEEVNKAIVDLAEALVSIELMEPEVELEVEALEKLIEKSEQKLKSDLEDESREKLTEEIENSKAVLKKEGVKQEEINAQFNKLLEAYVNAKEKVKEPEDKSFTFMIKKIEDEVKNVSESLSEIIGDVKYQIYDIEVFDADGTKISESEEKIEVEIGLEGVDLSKAKNISVYHINPDKTYDKVDDVEVVEGKLVFRHNRFSPFVIAFESEEPQPEDPKPEDPK
ncbi:MAG: beta-N-acetylglucosaminidase domain-containing protein, partial [Tissierellia bacterium]|nr:beta-N-acetylglucosaminidase domain-containing protein [Tissierellia bacterium]